MKAIKRKAFICMGCNFVYCDDPVSSCDCMLNPAKFIEGEINYTIPDELPSPIEQEGGGEVKHPSIMME